MWQTAGTKVIRLSHDMPCVRCGHPMHTVLACSDRCDCVPPPRPGIYQAHEPVGSATAPVLMG